MNHTRSSRRSHAGLRLLVSVLMGVGLSLFAVPARTARAASITVTTTADELADNGQCSLREAIRSANLDQAIGGCPAGNGADTISLPAGTYLLTVYGQYEDAGLRGDLDITTSLSIVGAGASTTIINGNGQDGVLEIFSQVTVQLSNLTVENHGNGSVLTSPFNSISIWPSSTATLANSSIRNNIIGGVGNSGTLTITNSTISSNGGRGVGNSGTLTITNSTISNNLNEWGGGISNEGTAYITNTIVSGNQSIEGGGGIWNSGTLTLANSTISNNIARASTGGGIRNAYGATMQITNTTISGNAAPVDFAGGIHNVGTMRIANSTVTQNMASGLVGGVSNSYYGPLILVNSIISNNTLSNNTLSDCDGTVTSQGYNLIQSPLDVQSPLDCMIEGVTTGNLVGVDPRLGPLQGNGGPTPTHTLLPGSPAIDAGHPATPGSSDMACATTDQRGIVRSQDGNGDGVARCDIGAVEMERPASAQGLTGAYDDSRDFTGLKRTRIDPTVSFDWGYSSPDAAIADSTFSVRWTGQVIPRFSEPYTFITQNDDGVRLWVNGQLLIDDWHDHGLSEHQGVISLQAGVPVAIRLDYYENHGQAAVKLLWASPSQPKEIIPSSQLRPAPGLIGAYYQNGDFTSLVLSRQDATINFDWGYGSPDASIEDSTFSVRWTGQVIPRFSEPYTFITQNDDGVRLWINNQLIIDDWQDHGLTEHQGMIALQAGVPVSLRLDYYENHGQAAVKLLWASASQPKEVIPASQLVPPQ